MTKKEIREQRKSLKRDKLLSVAEIREELRHLGIARYYYQGAMRMLLHIINSDLMPKSEPKIDADYKKKGIKVSLKKWNDFFYWHFLRQALNDRRLLESILLEEEVVPKYGRITEKGKDYLTVKYYPQSQIKYLKIFQDYDTDGE